MQCDPRQLPSDFRVEWLPGETTGFFRLSFSGIVPSGYSGCFPIGEEICFPLELGSHPSINDGWPPGLSGSTLNMAGHSSIGFSINIVLHVSHLLTSLQQEGGHWVQKHFADEITDFIHAASPHAPSSIALHCEAMAQPRGDYSRVQISVDICASAAPNDPGL